MGFPTARSDYDTDYQLQKLHGSLAMSVIYTFQRSFSYVHMEHLISDTI